MSNLVTYLLKDVVKYRKKVIQDNLRNAFPEKSPEEIQRLTRDFYRNFSDIIFEFIKMISISKETLARRVRPKNPEIIPEMTAHGGGSVVVFGHNSNWEWNGAGMGLHLPFDTYGIYKPLSNPHFDRLILETRNRLENNMIPQSQAYRKSITLLREPTAIAFLSDQNPTRTPGMYFVPFFGRLVPVHLGISSIALKLACPVYYFDIQRVKRGYYEVEIVPIPSEKYLPSSPENIRAFAVAQVKVLEESIRKSPANWLWSHRRWKHMPREGDSTAESKA